MSEPGNFVNTTSKINLNVKFWYGREKNYMLEPSDTVHRLKDMIWNDEGLFRHSTVFVYELSGGTLRKFQDEESFSEQGITSTHPTARVYALRYRATGSHDPDEISEEEKRRFRHVIRRGKFGNVVFERFYGG
jgi:hypothetical protein